MLLNYLRFDSPFETGYGYTEQLRQDYLQFVYPHGLFDISYIQRHPPIILEQMPLFQTSGPYILPTWSGMAIWATTPAFFLAYFPNIRREPRLWIPGAVILALAAGLILSRAIAQAWNTDWATMDIPHGLQFLPFWLMIAVAIGAAVRFSDKLVIACWAAIIPTGLFIFTFAATGWSQFGYRYALDFTPFLWLLVARAIGDDMKWHHLALIGTGVLVNLMGVLWIYQFGPNLTNGWEWVRF
jgi:hypothetical protein